MLQWLDVLGSDDQPWLAVFFGNVIYITIIAAIPLVVGWLLYTQVMSAVATRWPQGESTAAVLLAPIAALPTLTLLAFIEGWAGVLFASGYALTCGCAVRLARDRAKTRS